MREGLCTCDDHAKLLDARVKPLAGNSSDFGLEVQCKPTTGFEVAYQQCKGSVK